MLHRIRRDPPARVAPNRSASSDRNLDIHGGRVLEWFAAHVVSKVCLLLLNR